MIIQSNQTIEEVTRIRDEIYEQFVLLEQLVVKMGGKAIIHQENTSQQVKPNQAKPSFSIVSRPQVAAAQNQQTRSKNTDSHDSAVLSALLKSDEDFSAAKSIIEGSKKFGGITLNGMQMRAALQRLIAAGLAEDNGRERAAKRYRATVDHNPFESSDDIQEDDVQEEDQVQDESQQDEETQEQEDEFQEEDLDRDVPPDDESPDDESLEEKSNNNGTLTIENAVLTILEAEGDEMPMRDLIESISTSFPRNGFSDDDIRTKITEMDAKGILTSEKRGIRKYYNIAG